MCLSVGKRPQSPNKVIPLTWIRPHASWDQSWRQNQPTYATVLPLKIQDNTLIIVSYAAVEREKITIAGRETATDVTVITHETDRELIQQWDNAVTCIRAPQALVAQAMLAVGLWHQTHHFRHVKFLIDGRNS
jgi:hypothetical protein